MSLTKYKTINLSHTNYEALCNLSRHESFDKVIEKLVKSARKEKSSL